MGMSAIGSSALFVLAASVISLKSSSLSPSGMGAGGCFRGDPANCSSSARNLQILQVALVHSWTSIPECRAPRSVELGETKPHQSLLSAPSKVKKPFRLVS